MYHPGAKVRQLGGFLIREHRNRSRFGHHARIGREHTADIGPDLDLARMKSSTDERRGVIRSSATEGSGYSVLRAADKATEHWNVRRREQRQDLRCGRLGCLRQGCSASVVFISLDAAPSIDVSSSQSIFVKHCGQQL